MRDIIQAIKEELEYYKENPYEDGDKRYPLTLPTLEQVINAQEFILSLPDGARKPSIEFISSGGINLSWYSSDWGEWALDEPNTRTLVSVAFMTEHNYKTFLGIRYQKETKEVIMVQKIGEGTNLVAYPDNIQDTINLIYSDICETNL